ncbi:hypothetical protein [Gudongella oleilytica]|uniref:hypothetical protein n=1 Tax=Gudongella oleilytica TaxID=1582259 RepID=UPI000FF876EA|nr:hypothetical protein [Gudongella oleilytica]
MVVETKSYCMICKQAITNSTEHECQIKRQVLTDPILVGIVDRLYNLGLEPVMAIYSVNSVGTASDMYHPSIVIQLSKHLKYKILGELPAGWKYCWNDGKVFSLDYNDSQSYTDAEESEEHIKEVVKDFEAFLDTRDVESTKALMLLMACG